MAKRKQNISASERARRRRQALINFGSRSKTKRRGSTVARRKVSRKRRSFRGVSRSDEKLGVILPAGFGYGLVREYASDKLAPLTNKIPLGNVSDEVGMLGILYAARKWLFKKKSIFRDVAKGGMYVEAARIGQATKDGQLGGIFNFGNAQTSLSSSVPVV